MNGFVNFLGLMAGEQEISDRKNALTNKVGKQIVDTCLANDTDKWETGIKRNGEEWIIVEKYLDEKVAKKRHKYWVNKLGKNPKMEIEDVGFKEWL